MVETENASTCALSLRQTIFRNSNCRSEWSPLLSWDSQAQRAFGLSLWVGGRCKKQDPSLPRPSSSLTHTVNGALFADKGPGLRTADGRSGDDVGFMNDDDGERRAAERISYVSGIERTYGQNTLKMLQNPRGARRRQQQEARGQRAEARQIKRRRSVSSSVFRRHYLQLPTALKQKYMSTFL